MIDGTIPASGLFLSYDFPLLTMCDYANQQCALFSPFLA